MGTLLVKSIGILQTPTGSYSHKGEEQGKNLKLEKDVYKRQGQAAVLRTGGN